MRIHLYISRSEASGIIRSAAKVSRTDIERYTVHGSRSHSLAVDVILSGDGVTGGGWGNSGTHGAGAFKAATWDQWGIFLNHLFAVDPSAKTRDYADADDFHWKTGGRFQELTADETCYHRWEFEGFSASGPYLVHRCRKCESVRRLSRRG